MAFQPHDMIALHPVFDPPELPKTELSSANWTPSIKTDTKQDVDSQPGHNQEPVSYLKGQRATIRVAFNVPLDASKNVTNLRCVAGAIPATKYALRCEDGRVDTSSAALVPVDV
ncbi:uncharacterized protein SPSK_06745 [Sporothrix schenckii 1099-18]|uniref:Uncharacterized protein n=1 Tax=Sporothrix schenckii 1099-18 TaxID=1397361 RepID=A0A0F2MMG4_SPOSC|nr:uncharacterized protein SPSK_06745 [Sporothrix schenckii 1099-18]KJR90015.1 hypothetical protein SPSK_06745 [Sporothrix schenckii 1099-18]